MLQIVYISTARPDFDPREIEGILDAARLHNIENAITGLIFYNGQRFLQALEGEDAMVRATFARIVANPRHFGVVKLYERTIEQREFGPWAMTGFIINGDRDETEVIANVDRLVADVPDPNIREQFRSFARVKRAA